MIEDSLKKRKHVIEYSSKIIPAKTDIENILKVGYELASSKQNSFPYKVFVLGPDKKRSQILQSMTENQKIDFDGELDDTATYVSNPNLMHISTAPYTLIFTHRLSPPNAYYQLQIDMHDTEWEFDKVEYLKRCRSAYAIEVGILATTITGAAMDRGWDSSYCVCFPSLQGWGNFPYVEYTPFLIQTIGRGIKFRKDVYRESSMRMDTRPSFETIFEFVEGETNEKL